MSKPLIAHLAGPAATIQNTPPLVTSNKARTKHGLTPRTNTDGTPARFDVLRAQRLAAPVMVYVKQHSAHPLESDAAGLYGPPDGYLDASGAFHKERTSATDTAVYEIELHPDDGLYPLPYMARQADGSAWEEECAFPGAPVEQARQPFFPDGSRSFEEIDRLGFDSHGVGNLISEKAEIAFHRILPTAGYTRGNPPEERGRAFFAYKPHHLIAIAPRPSLARVANGVQEVLADGRYAGAIWTEGSPTIEETLYWLNLLVDTTLPICGNAAQRPHGSISNDGPKNIVDSVDYIASSVWADANGRDRAGVVLIADQRIYSARTAMKVDARPGGYVATGGLGGVLGAVGADAPPVLMHLPTSRFTASSQVNLTRLPREVRGLRGATVAVKDAAGKLLERAIPKVAITKDGSYASDDYDSDISREVDLLALLDSMLRDWPLAGFVVEALTPYGTMTSSARQSVLLRAVYSGIPVVRTGRGNVEGFARPVPPFIGGSNLTATKARILLLAALLKLGALPAAADPDQPTEAEQRDTREHVARYQEIFDTH